MKLKIPTKQLQHKFEHMASSLIKKSILFRHSVTDNCKTIHFDDASMIEVNY